MRLLVIEDSSSLRSSLEKGLRRSGYAVDSAADGSEGLWRAEGGHYDVIILDLMLPKLDGWTLLDRIRRREDSTAILVLTARDAVEDRVRAFARGAQDYLIKPFAFEELLARVRSLCQRSFGQRSQSSTCGSLIIDVHARRVWCSGVELELSRREFMLLEYLTARAGQVVSRASIEEHIYGDEEEIVSNAVDVAISRVRKKLDEQASAPKIRTRRGLGWMLEVDTR